MKLIFLYGMPATGKLTVARELAELTGYVIFHNHLTVDLLLSVFPFGSPEFVRLREQIWLSVVTEACRSGMPGMIFTFAPETTVRPEFIPNLVVAVERAHGEVVFVALVCPLAEVKARLADASRVPYKKLTSLELFEQLYADGVFDDSHMPVPRLMLDTSLLAPTEAADEIVRQLGLTGSQRSAAG